MPGGSGYDDTESYVSGNKTKLTIIERTLKRPLLIRIDIIGVSKSYSIGLSFVSHISMRPARIKLWT